MQKLNSFVRTVESIGTLDHSCFFIVDGIERPNHELELSQKLHCSPGDLNTHIPVRSGCQLSTQL